MTLLLSCESISKAFGSKVLFQDLSFGIFRGEKIGIIGPNGAGKTSFMKILAGIDAPDTGQMSQRKNLKIGYVPQVAVFPSKTVIEILVDAQSDDHTLEHYQKEVNAQIIMSKIGFENPDQNAQTLSGG
jgi:ABC transport system ATP-binding/permease protein